MREVADIVVVGSGAGGAVCAKVLAESGLDVLLLEEGQRLTSDDFDSNLWRSIKRTFRGLGTTVANGRSMIPVLQAKAVGGTTVINSAIMWRTPEDVLDEWRIRFGLGEVLSGSELDEAFDILEKDLSIAPTPEEVLTGSDKILRSVCEEFGLRPRPTDRAVVNCEGSCLCLQGCQGDRKQSMALTYIPAFEKAGGRVIDGFRVDTVTIDGGRATGVTGHRVKPATSEAMGGTIEIGARKGVVVAASAIGSPQLLQRSGLKSKVIGEHFQAHPGVGVAGFFPDQVNMWDGATQGFEGVAPRSERIKIETLSLPPELLSVRLPGIGRPLMSDLGNLRHAALWAVLVRPRAEGRVRNPKGALSTGITYSVTSFDLQIYAKGIKLACDMMFAAGAEYVIPGVFGLPERLTAPDQTKLITDRPLDSRQLTLAATHLFGTTRMGPDPASSVVNTRFECHEVERLYVADTGLFPTNMGVNPQLTVMGLAMLAGRRIAESV